MGYFLADLLTTQPRSALVNRRHRLQLPGFARNPTWGLRFDAGDIIKFSYDRGPTTFSFEGLCLAVHGRGFGRKQTTFRVRNVVSGVGVEITLAYYVHRVYKLLFSDYKRKNFRYNKKRLYYLRQRMNRESQVN
jgi:ribosomal protein L19